jgi:hypothetical protein
MLLELGCNVFGMLLMSLKNLETGAQQVLKVLIACR